LDIDYKVKVEYFCFEIYWS